MDRSWMYGLRNSPTYLEGLREFICKAVAYQTQQGDDRILCPCTICRNMSKEANPQNIYAHLLTYDFRENYNVWTLHGESRVESCATTSHADNVSLKRKADLIGSSSNIGDHRAYASNHAHDNESNENENDEDDRIDDLLTDVKGNFDFGPKAYRSLLDAAKTALCPGSTFSKLSAVLKLFRLKAKHGWTNSSFTELLETLADMYPGSTLPTMNYEAIKLTCPMGTKVQKIHACPNDCILYRKEYENLDECPKCHLPRYKKKVNASGVAENKKTRIPVKVLWDIPIILRFRRLFSNAKDSKLLVWHAEKHKKDGFMRHLAHAAQWRQIVLKYPEFGSDARNL